MYSLFFIKCFSKVSSSLFLITFLWYNKDQCFNSHFIYNNNSNTYAAVTTRQVIV